MIVLLKVLISLLNAYEGSHFYRHGINVTLKPTRSGRMIFQVQSGPHLMITPVTRPSRYHDYLCVAETTSCVNALFFVSLKRPQSSYY